MEKSFVWVEIIFFRSKKYKNSLPKEDIDWNLEGTKLITKLAISKLGKFEIALVKTRNVP
jgi:hypothetical protein